MQFNVDVVLKDTKDAVTERVTYHVDPSEWTEEDVRAILAEILVSIARVRDPEAGRPGVALRGFSWIVEPWEGQVVIAIEIPTGAAVAGPFDVAQARLDGMIRRALAAPPLGAGGTIH